MTIHIGSAIGRGIFRACLQPPHRLDFKFEGFALAAWMGPYIPARLKTGGKRSS